MTPPQCQPRVRQEMHPKLFHCSDKANGTTHRTGNTETGSRLEPPASSCLLDMTLLNELHTAARGPGSGDREASASIRHPSAPYWKLPPDARCRCVGGTCSARSVVSVVRRASGVRLGDEHAPLVADAGRAKKTRCGTIADKSFSSPLQTYLTCPGTALSHDFLTPMIFGPDLRELGWAS